VREMWEQTEGLTYAQSYWQSERRDAHAQRSWCSFSADEVAAAKYHMYFLTSTLKYSKETCWKHATSQETLEVRESVKE